MRASRLAQQNLCVHLLQFLICLSAWAFEVLQVFKHPSTLTFSEYTRHGHCVRCWITSSNWLSNATLELSVHEVSQCSLIAWGCIVTLAVLTGLDAGCSWWEQVLVCILVLSVKLLLLCLLVRGWWQIAEELQAVSVWLLIKHRHFLHVRFRFTAFKAESGVGILICEVCFDCRFKQCMLIIRFCRVLMKLLVLWPDKVIRHESTVQWGNTVCVKPERLAKHRSWLQFTVGLKWIVLIHANRLMGWRWV